MADRSNDGFGDARPLGTAEWLKQLYAELRRRAAHRLRKDGGRASLSPTTLVHETYLRLARQRTVWKGRTHFCAIAAKAMRRILVDHARRRHRAERALAKAPIVLSNDYSLTDGDDRLDVLDLDAALRELARSDSRAARVVELRFFGGLSEREVAGQLGVKYRTVQEDWAYARAWLQRELRARRDGR